MKELKVYLEKVLNMYIGKFTDYDLDRSLTTILNPTKYHTKDYYIWIVQENHTENKIDILIAGNSRKYFSYNFKIGTITYKKVKDEKFSTWHDTFYLYKDFNVNINDTIINEDFTSFAEKVVKTWDKEIADYKEACDKKHQETLKIYEVIMKTFNCSYREAHDKLYRIEDLSIDEQKELESKMID